MYTNNKREGVGEGEEGEPKERGGRGGTQMLQTNAMGQIQNGKGENCLLRLVQRMKKKENGNC